MSSIKETVILRLRQYFVIAFLCAGIILLSSSDSMALQAPQSVTASKGGVCDVIFVSWTNVTGANAYDVFRSVTNDPRTAELIYSVTSSPVEDTNNFVVGQGYYYWVKAKYVQSGSETIYSPFSESTDDSFGYEDYVIELDAPATISTSQTYNDKVVLSWDTVPGASGYNIYRSDGNDISTAVLHFSAESPPQEDTIDIESGKNYYYWLQSKYRTQGEIYVLSPLSSSSGGFAGFPVFAEDKDSGIYEFGIESVYPNPFNSSTTISFTLPGAGSAELAVYNMAGQKIRTLVAGEFSPGTHEVVWDGRDDAGIPLSSGIFFSRLVTDNTVATNRMTLVK